MTLQTNLTEENKEYEERFRLAAGRIREIMSESFPTSFCADYFQKTSAFLSMILDTYELIQEQRITDAFTDVSVDTPVDNSLDKSANRSVKSFADLSLEELQRLNHDLYEDILPEHYANSYANPDYAIAKLGSDYGPLLCALYAELRSNIVHIFEQRLFYLCTSMELYLEIYSILQEEEATPEAVRSAFYYYCFDYSDITIADRSHALLDPDRDCFTPFILEADLEDLRYLYYTGEYVSENEYQTAAYLNSLPLSQIQDMARTYTEGFRKGFEVYDIDLSQKKTVNIRYSLGFERMIREAILQFQEMGLQAIIYRAGVNLTRRSAKGRIGFHGAFANQQYDYDHRLDEALIFDKAYADRCLDVQRLVYENMKTLCLEYAGPAVVETFGETLLPLEEKQSIPQYSKKQQKQKLKYQSASALLSNEFIPGDQVSFTIIAYPVPEIGDNYPEIFDATVKVNTLDTALYQEIQTTIIEALDQGVSVHISGRGENKTDITVALTPMTDPASQTRFENCLADVNIPLGEVFTSPKLKGTNGILHVSQSYLNGLRYENICLEFRDGIIVDYQCSNYAEEEKNKKYIENNLLFQHETLPMGEFAIGTNTTAYAMGQKYGISHLLPILIEEKTGPHFAIGDTCFSHEEDMRTYNPDGKEMIAKENDYSKLRHSDSSKAYFNCHTDITIPYHELGDIIVNREDGSQIEIIKEGCFVLPGTEVLNEALPD